MGRGYSDFKNLLGGGVRSSGYEVILPIDLINIALSTLEPILNAMQLSGYADMIKQIAKSTPHRSILVKSTSTPGLQQEVIPVKWHGNTFKISGAVEYNDWEATHYLEPDSLLYDFYHFWFYISTFYNSQGQGIYLHPDWYNYPFMVFTKDSAGVVNGGWLMVGFISNIGDMQLTADSEDLLEYNITYSINRQIRIPSIFFTAIDKISGALPAEGLNAILKWAGDTLGFSIGRGAISSGDGASGKGTSL